MNPVFEKPKDARFIFQGFVGARCRANLENWLLTFMDANPAMLQIFRDRDKKPRQEIVPWAGESAGKYLISAVLGWRMNHDERLHQLIVRLIQDLADVQDKDGYMGPFPKEERLTGKTHDGKYDLWDVWGHYHSMLGLLMWFEETGSKLALDVCRKSADLLCRRFLNTGERIINAKSEELNMAVIHVLCLLYRRTGEERYLSLAREIEKDWETPPAGDYVRSALAGKEFYETPKPRWESLHDVQSILELYWITGDNKYRSAFEHIWWSILKGDRHNTGGFSSNEKAIGNPYAPCSIETCCTIAWIALSIDMLKLTGNSLVADEIELSTFNALFGAQSPSGRWWTYNTPMDGKRIPFVTEKWQIWFQGLPAGPEINCCQSNAGRGIGMLTEWAVMTAQEGVVINYYGSSIFTVILPSGARLNLTQVTNYPVDGDIILKLGLEREERFVLRLRIPIWSIKSSIAVNEQKAGDPVQGRYFSMDREWRDGDLIHVQLDMSFHFLAGEREVAGKSSIYRGPILLTYDQRYGDIEPEDLPAMDAVALNAEIVQWNHPPVPWLLLRVKAAEGRYLFLCDFASAGAVGTQYYSWLPLTVGEPYLFTKENPVWNMRPRGPSQTRKETSTVGLSPDP